MKTSGLNRKVTITFNLFKPFFYEALVAFITVGFKLQP
jgi:hypothetical protein